MAAASGGGTTESCEAVGKEGGADGRVNPVHANGKADPRAVDIRTVPGIPPRGKVDIKKAFKVLGLVGCLGKTVREQNR